VSNADERQQPTRTYANRGILLPGLKPARQRLGFKAPPRKRWRVRTSSEGSIKAFKAQS
jgi:hypothetical protein